MKDGLVDGHGDESRNAPGPRDAAAPPLTQDNVFDALSSKRSRYVLTYLRGVESPAEIPAVVEAVAEWETGKPIGLVSEEHCDRVRTSLRHSQLPKLSMMGLVEYDETAGVVERGPHAEQADAYLDVATDRDENVAL
ncbi:DUF7344 domain-containing protein [Halorussus halobius]|uniref:DUF7344 domain-containing protein n=1 Tax=Halorussus halobius TaxID=1710537 RepID=UPI00109263B9|nr:hypothetical protein [Halorussus halobius]